MASALSSLSESCWRRTQLTTPANRSPIFLTTVHLAYATLGTRLLLRFTHLVDGVADIQMSWDRWLKNIVPIGALFSGSVRLLPPLSLLWRLQLTSLPPRAQLVFSNLAYLSLSVSFIQMLKAFTCVSFLWPPGRDARADSRANETSSVAVLTMSVLMGLDKFNKRTATTVVAISLGVALASYGELNLCSPFLSFVVTIRSLM